MQTSQPPFNCPATHLVPGQVFKVIDLNTTYLMLNNCHTKPKHDLLYYEVVNLNDYTIGLVLSTATVTVLKNPPQPEANVYSDHIHSN